MTTSESDCNRVSSKLDAELEANTGTWVPVDEVSVMPTMGKVKLRMVVFAGGVSEMETLSKASPFPQFVMHRLCVPLQEESERTAANTAKTRYFLEFMQTPHDGFGGHLWRLCAAGFSPPTLYSSPLFVTYGKLQIAQILTLAAQEWPGWGCAIVSS